MDDNEGKFGYAQQSSTIDSPTTYSTLQPQRQPYTCKKENSSINAGEEKMVIALVLKDGRLGVDRVSDKGNNSSATLGTKSCGHMCSRCIRCDIRQTVILVNLIHIAIHVFIAAVLFAPLRNKMPTGRGMKLQHFIVYVAVTRTANIIGIFGAMRYNIYLLGLNALYYFISMVMYFMEDAFVLSMVAGALLYPHIRFIQQVQNGSTTMSHKNNRQEKHSCCCA